MMSRFNGQIEIHRGVREMHRKLADTLSGPANFCLCRSAIDLCLYMNQSPFKHNINAKIPPITGSGVEESFKRVNFS